MFRKLADRLSSSLQSATESLAGVSSSNSNTNNSSRNSNSNSNSNTNRKNTSSNNTNNKQKKNKDKKNVKNTKKNNQKEPPMSTPATASSVNPLVNMGFSEASARQALNRFQGNMQRAADYLLSTATTPSGDQYQQSSNLSTSIAAIQKTHPSVKLPPTLQQKTREEQIFRCTNRLEKYPSAIDTLYKTIQRIRQNPHDRKYWTIDMSVPAVQKLIQTPGAMDFLKAMDYHPTNRNILKLQRYDAATMYIGTLALGQCQLESPIYRRAKQVQQFVVQVQTTMLHKDEQQVAHHLKHVPTASVGLGGSPIFIYFEGMDTLPTNDNLKYLTRNFDGDDTLEDVLHWLASHGPDFWKQLVVERNWEIVDVNLTNPKPLQLWGDNENCLPKTLQYLGFWPSGKLMVRSAVNDNDESKMAPVEITNRTPSSSTTVSVVV